MKEAQAIALLLCFVFANSIVGSDFGDPKKRVTSYELSGPIDPQDIITAQKDLKRSGDLLRYSGDDFKPVSNPLLLKVAPCTHSRKTSDDCKMEAAYLAFLNQSNQLPINDNN